MSDRDCHGRYVGHKKVHPVERVLMAGALFFLACVLWECITPAKKPEAVAATCPRWSEADGLILDKLCDVKSQLAELKEMILCIKPVHIVIVQVQKPRDAVAAASHSRAFQSQKTSRRVHSHAGHSRRFCNKRRHHQ